MNEIIHGVISIAIFSIEKLIHKEGRDILFPIHALIPLYLIMLLGIGAFMG